MTTGTVGWVGVGDMSYNVFVPYYPMLLTDSKDMYEGYQVSLPSAVTTAEQPDGFYTFARNGKYVAYPEDWQDSYYFSFEGLGSYMANQKLSDADKQYVRDQMTALQNKFNKTFADVTVENATATSRQMAKNAHAKALEMLTKLMGKDTVTGLSVVDKSAAPLTKPQVKQILIPVVEVASCDVYGKSQPTMMLVPSNAPASCDIYGKASPYTRYEWRYANSDKVISTDSIYTVSESDQGKILCLDVKVDGCGGSASWKAEAAVPYLPDSGRDDSSSGGSGSGGGSSTKPSKPTTPTNPKPDTSNAFNDVASGSWYADAVKNVVNKGLMAGTGKDTFAPNNQVTRAMMWTVLARLDGKDVSGASTWYAKAMTWATEKGVSDGTFPGNSITREQLATMLWRAAGSPEAKGALTNFNDAASVSSWATQAMTWAVEQGLISGMGDGALNPQGNATRAQLAVILTAYAK